MPRAARADGPARDTAAEALASAEAIGDRKQVRDSHASVGWLAGLAGDTAEAEQQFTAADQIEVADERTAITYTRCAGTGGRSGWPAPDGPARPGR